MPASEDELYLTCSACGSIHTISDAGDLELVEDRREGRKGIGGIRTHTAGKAGNDWQNELYRQSEPQQYQPPLQMREPGRAGAPVKPNTVDSHTVCPELMEAHQKDLKERNIH